MDKFTDSAEFNKAVHKKMQGIWIRMWDLAVNSKAVNSALFGSMEKVNNDDSNRSGSLIKIKRPEL